MSADTEGERERRLYQMAEDLGLSPELLEVVNRNMEAQYLRAWERQRELDAEMREALERRIPEVLKLVERTVLHPALVEHGLNPDDYRLEWS